MHNNTYTVHTGTLLHCLAHRCKVCVTSSQSQRPPVSFITSH